MLLPRICPTFINPSEYPVNMKPSLCEDFYCSKEKLCLKRLFWRWRDSLEVLNTAVSLWSLNFPRYSVGSKQKEQKNGDIEQCFYPPPSYPSSSISRFWLLCIFMEVLCNHKYQLGVIYTASLTTLSDRNLYVCQCALCQYFHHCKI